MLRMDDSQFSSNCFVILSIAMALYSLYCDNIPIGLVVGKTVLDHSFHFFEKLFFTYQIKYLFKCTAHARAILHF